MKILAMPDLHARETAPRCRTDDYLAALMGKLDWAGKLSQDEAVDVVVFPGDIFDSCRASDNLKRLMIDCFHYSFDDVIGVAGQHDQRYHTKDLNNTPLGVLQAAGAMAVIGESGLERWVREGCRFYGTSWGEDIPEIKSEGFNILVIHKMIIKGLRVWPGQTDYSFAKRLLEKHDYDLIISGDNHQFFMEEYEGRWLINCGSLMRQSINQVKYHPAVVIFDTEIRQPETYEIPVKPIEEVMKLEEVEDEKERNEKLEEFVSSLGSDGEHIELDFLSNLKATIRNSGLGIDVEDVIWEAVGKEE